MNKKRVMVGLSGGVDSSVAALLLKQQGYLVEGLFMKNWEEDDTETYCPASLDRADAEAVCAQLDIPLHTINFAAEYWDRVFTHFLAEYKAGRTPNPDILCNKEIKFKLFLDYALHHGADFIATGHYAGKAWADSHYLLQKSRDQDKDQTYFLYTLGQEALKKTLFPLANQLKSEVRALAKAAGLPTHAKKDSTGICFIGERKFRQFLAHYLPATPGPIETLEGQVIGEHHGLMYYTLGQRQGLGIGGQKNATEQPWYVVAKQVDRNVLVVAQGKKHPALYAKTLCCAQLHWVTGEKPTLPYRCTAKIRYRQTETPCLLTQESVNTDSLQVVFSEAQWAITPGQSVVFYQESNCLGGGVIL